MPAALITLSATLAMQSCDREQFLKACDFAFKRNNPPNKDVH